MGNQTCIKTQKTVAGPDLAIKRHYNKKKLAPRKFHFHLMIPQQNL